MEGEKMGLKDILIDLFFDPGKIIPMDGPQFPKIPGVPLENIRDAIDPAQIVKRKLFGVDPEEAESKFDAGDHLYTQRLGYTHHGIYVGDGDIIHYLDSGITEDSLDSFSGGSKIAKKHSYKKYGQDEIVERAYSRIGEEKYSVLWRNCEQFALWCRNGKKLKDDREDEEIEAEDEGIDSEDLKVPNMFSTWFPKSRK